VLSNQGGLSVNTREAEDVSTVSWETDERHFTIDAIRQFLWVPALGNGSEFSRWEDNKYGGVGAEYHLDPCSPASERAELADWFQTNRPHDDIAVPRQSHCQHPLGHTSEHVSQQQT